tara:strand:+ start:926 stop:2389 length:1464 start_codon:yes stop_codon:yes gene_type:complete
MENSAIKIARSLFNKKNVNNFKRNLNKKTISIGISALFLLIATSYFIRPIFINYGSETKIIEKKINTHFKLDSEIKGKVSYKFFPSPRLEIKKLNLNFNNSKNKIFLEQAYVLIPIFGEKNLKSLEFKKFLIFNETIKIDSKEFKNYLKYFTILKEKDVILKNCILFFLDDQNNKVIFQNVNLKDKFNKVKHLVDFNSDFSNKKVRLKFINKINKEKNLDVEIPQLNTSINAIFDPSSNLNKVKGKSKVKLFDSVLTLNFEGKNKFKIYESFFRNKFLNSKISGEVSFMNGLFFDLNLGINQINLRKFLLYYFPEDKNYGFLNSGISKKLNGKFKIFMKNTNSFIGRINDIKMLLIFENGDMRIENASAILPQGSKINFNILYSDNYKEPFLDFSLNFYSQNSKKFLRKFNIYNFSEKEVSLLINGKINLKTNKIKFKNIVANNREKFDRKDVLNLEKNFNQFVLDQGVLGITDFFRLKKFAKEVLG